MDCEEDKKVISFTDDLCLYLYIHSSCIIIVSGGFGRKRRTSICSADKEHCINLELNLMSFYL